jgi:aerobic carbon-monoxide dehydrogenase small subunit
MSRKHAIQVQVNGETHDALVAPRLLLADLLREELDLTGTHLGCEHGVCGACTVLVDDRPVRACLMFAVQADGCAVQTVEGLARDSELHPVQQAFNDNHGLQCGFCTPGFLMSTVAFLEGNPDPTEDEVLDMLGGHLCRCTGYQNIVASVRQAADEMRREASKA